jgi:DNA polymerase-1
VAERQGEPGRLLLIDGHSLAYRAFYALPVENFSTTTGQPTNAVYGFTSMLINALRDEQPTHAAVAFDVSAPTFRHAEFAEYKATRSETPTDFRGQVSLIRDVLQALGIPIVTAEGFEADDVIATLATQAETEGMNVLVLTGDRDVYQLVTDHITVLMTRRGISEMTRFTPAELMAAYGLTAAQYPDFAALRGDPSDNLPGIPGVGEKTALKLVQQFGDLPTLVDRADELPGKTGAAVRAHLAQVVRNRRLTQLSRDVPLDIGPHDLHLGGWDREQVHQLFDTLQFRVLRERLYATLSSPEPEAEEGFAADGVVLDAGEVAGWLTEHLPPAAGRAGLWLEGSWARGTGNVSGVAIAAPDGAAAWLDPTAVSQEDDLALADWLADPTRPKAGHDLKGPLLALRARGWPTAGLTSDTALAAYLVLPGQRSFDLADLALRYLRRELRAETPADGQLSLDGSAEEDRAAAAMVRARAVAALADVLDRELEQRGGTQLLHEVELPLLHLLADMEEVGIAADVDLLAGLAARFGGEVKQVAEAAYACVGREFNLGSPKQLQQILFDELQLPKTKRIKTGYTTDADALQWLATQTDHPLIEHLLRHRDVSRLKTVVDSLIPMVDERGRIHTTFNQTVAATGRLSSQDPNLQNIPIRTAEGREIRRAFVVGEDYELLLTADYSQIEMRIMAHLSGDEGLIAALRSGADFHAATAARVFGLDAGQVPPEVRARVKAMNFGLAYGLSAYGLSQQLNIDVDEARVLMDEYFQRFGGVRDYLAGVVHRARREGYTETIMGRRRYLPDLSSDNAQRRQMAERMALNAPIQGSAADIIKIAMIRVGAASAAAGLRSRLLLQVHDELVFEVGPGERAALEALVREQMGGAYPLSVPLEVSIGAGRSWDEAAH